MNSHLTNALNPEQAEAVTSRARFLRVLAGAGSGKTRVLVHRAAFLIDQAGVSPYEILAVTFTNKAANEMRSRIAQLCGIPVKGAWIGTFHGLAHRFLRIHYHKAGLSEQFQIMDSDDQLRLVKRIHKELDIQDGDCSPKNSVSFINGEKDEGRYPQGGQTYDRQTRLMQEVYGRYHQICQQSHLVDFAELLLRSLNLFQHNPDVLHFYHQKFKHIMVDEFQDTNAIQFRWLQQLLGPHSSLMIVGDDDQSIYGWRGAQIQNILNFSESYPETHTVYLEQNYRSTQSILSAANAVIACNQDRLGKSLWTTGQVGEPIKLYSAYNEVDEAKFVVERIADFHAQGIRYSQQAVLYRSNAQSRALEEALLYARIPYRIYGGQRFFDRAEIKNAMAYLRLIALTDDDAAFERVVNFPARGLGDRSVQMIRDQARCCGQSMWQASQELLKGQTLSARARIALAGFMEMIQGLRDLAASVTLSELVQSVLAKSKLIEAYARESQEQRLTREDNLRELVSASSHFDGLTDFESDDLLDPEMRQQEQGLESFAEKSGRFAALNGFLEHVSLESGEQQAGSDQDSVQLMTIHASKGLEFPVVFLCGMEEGLFPSQMSTEPGRLEEERRLCYVGITRAEKILILSHAESRRIYGEDRRTRVSRFVREIPEQYLEEIRLGTVQKPVIRERHSFGQQSVEAHEADRLRVGVRVMHRAFGEGVVLATDGRGLRMRVQVNFARNGSKWLMANIASLQVLGA